MTYSYVILKVSSACHAEIREKLEQAGYEHCFHEDEDGLLIDLHGIAIQAESA